LAFGSIFGKTLVSDAAASTVGVDEDVEPELLFPQPAASAGSAIAISTAEKRRAVVARTWG
jgi:hypothetical protein